MDSRRLRIGALSLALLLPGFAQAGVTDQLQAARAALVAGDARTADKALDLVEAAAPAEGAVVGSGQLAQLFFYRGVVEHLGGDKKGRALDAWRQALLFDNSFRWDSEVLDADDPRSLFEALRAEVRSRKRMDAFIPEKTGAARLYVDGERRTSSDQVLQGMHLAQIECPDGSVYGRWTDLNKDPKWFKLCPEGVDDTVVVQEAAPVEDEWAEFGPMFGSEDGDTTAVAVDEPDLGPAGVPAATAAVAAAKAKAKADADATAKAAAAAASAKAKAAAAAKADAATKAEADAVAAAKAEADAVAAAKAEADAAAAAKAQAAAAAAAKAQADAATKAEADAVAAKAKAAAAAKADAAAKSEADAVAAAAKAEADAAAKAEADAAAAKAKTDQKAQKKAAADAKKRAAAEAEAEAAVAKAQADAAAAAQRDAEAKAKTDAQAKTDAAAETPAGPRVLPRAKPAEGDATADAASTDPEAPTQVQLGGAQIGSGRSRQGLNPVGGYMMAGGAAFLGGATAVYFTAFAPNYEDVQAAQDGGVLLNRAEADKLEARHDTTRFTVLTLGGVGVAALIGGGVTLFLESELPVSAVASERWTRCLLAAPWAG